MSRRTLLLLVVVFISGMTSLAIELTASRFIGNYFGSALPVWAAIIGMVLVYLTIGYLLGGRLADRHPHEGYLYQVTMWAGFFTGLIPFLANPILQFATVGIRNVLANVFVGSLLGVIILLSLPMILLGCVSPFAIRLRTRSVESSGNTAGALYALSTMGSILGTFLPVLILIPTVGTRNTFLVFSFALMIPSMVGILAFRGRRSWVHGVLLLTIALLALFIPKGIVRAAEVGDLIYETESPYNYIQVIQAGDTRYLMLNEGDAVHSIYNPNQVLTKGEWDYVAVAPFFNKNYSASELKHAAIIGLAGGTTPRQLTKIYGPIAIDGIACYANLEAIPGGVDAVVIATAPAATSQVVQDCLRLGIKRVWIHRSFGRGSASPEAARMCRDNDIALIDGACPLMYCPPVDFFHRCLRGLFGVFGKLPKPDGEW